MTPEQIAETREIRTVIASGTADILFDQGGDALLKMTNDRGAYEVLATADRARDFVAMTTSGADLVLTGFWRRRSGFRHDGSRHFIWCLVLLSWEDVEAIRQAA